VKFLARRFLHSLALLLGVSLLSFVFLQLAPGSFFDDMQLNPQISRQTVAQLRGHYGLDKPLPVRYLDWLRSVAKGECGVSFAYNTPVAPLILARSRNTLLLTGTATLISWLIALPAGVLAAAAGRRFHWVDFATGLTTTLLLVIPDLLFALGVLWIAVSTRWVYAGGMFSPGSADSDFRHRLTNLALHLIAPVFVLVLGSLPVLVRHVRAAMVDALNSPYIRAIRAHGISDFRILFRHALPAAAAPLISLLGLSLGTLLSGSLLVEVILNWPGLGPLLLEAILARDVFVVIGSVMFSAIFLIGGMLAADILLFITDPRIRTEGLA
jgi:peptide/nickel transport system permease protein